MGEVRGRAAMLLPRVVLVTITLATLVAAQVDPLTTDAETEWDSEAVEAAVSSDPQERDELLRWAASRLNVVHHPEEALPVFLEEEDVKGGKAPKKAKPQSPLEKLCNSQSAIACIAVCTKYTLCIDPKTSKYDPKLYTATGKSCRNNEAEKCAKNCVRYKPCSDHLCGNTVGDTTPGINAMSSNSC